MRQLSILDPSERNRYVSDGVYIVRRAPKRFLGQLSSLIHRSNALGSSHGGACENVVVLLLFAAINILGIPQHHPTQKERGAPAPGPLT